MKQQQGGRGGIALAGPARGATDARSAAGCGEKGRDDGEEEEKKEGDEKKMIRKNFVGSGDGNGDGRW